MSKLVDIIENELDELLDPFLGEIGYGKLTKSGAWGIFPKDVKDIPIGCIGWTLTYYFIFNTVDAIAMFLTPAHQLIIHSNVGGKKYRKEGILIKDLKKILERIPYRRKREIRDFRKNYDELECSFLEKLAAVCNELDCEPTNLYTQKELEYARSLE